jgi:hypothetical protein
VIQLYTVTDEYIAILAELEESEGELSPEVEDRLDALDAEFTDRVENVCALVKSLDAEAKAIKDEEARLAARRKARENGARRLKEYLYRAMMDFGRRKVAGIRFTASIQAHPPKTVLDVPEDDVPAQWVKVVRKPCISDLAAALKAGDPEAAKVAHLEQGEGVSIR